MKVTAIILARKTFQLPKAEVKIQGKSFLKDWETLSQL